MVHGFDISYVACRVDVGGNKERDVGGRDEQTMTLFGRVAMIGHFRMNCIEQVKQSDLTVSFETQHESVAHFDPLYIFWCRDQDYGVFETEKKETLA